ncbi:M61 family peptidase [Pendulispora brunnea]|uniref:M61 family peptidase n=1 Tax=Pendulispora brunnea TaxID=2905690 RepID=A0ABZ2KJH9_9BACT
MRTAAGLGLVFGVLAVGAVGGCAPEAAAAPTTPRASLTGPIRVQVDARDVPQMVIHAKLTVPARPGALTLVYPKWIPGTHGPTGKVADISGLRFSAEGKPLAWKRDPEETSEFALNVPSGASAVEVELDVVVDKRWGETADVSDLNWNRVVLYPKGARARDVQFEPSVQVPAGWHYATALRRVSQGADAVSFQRVSLETLVDSPVIMGRYGRTIDLGTALGAPHALEIVSDTGGAVDANEKQITAYKRLVAEATTLFGARHYDAYSFLYILSSDGRSSSGLEHHASSQNLSMPGLFAKDDEFRAASKLLPHEYTHSWCGKYRRPKGLATPNYQEPTHNELLWVYEGLTEYTGWLLAGRSGLSQAQDSKDHLALIAATLDAIPARKWRSLGDTTYTPAFGQESNRPWYSAQRARDYYPESLLIWLEADTLIRQKTSGARSLDDFLRAFFGGASGGAEVKPYELGDLLAALNRVAEHDWKAFFEQRITEVAAHAPLGGIEGAGYRLAYRDKPSDLQGVVERVSKTLNERFTLGMVVNDKAVVTDLHFDGPAGRAGLVEGSILVAVNGRKYTAELLRRTIAENKGSASPIELLTERDGFYRTHRVAWNEGGRYPYLERVASKPDTLATMLAPRSR